jgi:peptidoglycan-associated lipoprotein
MKAFSASSIFAALVIVLGTSGCVSVPQPPPAKPVVEVARPAPPEAVTQQEQEQGAMTAVNAENSVFFATNSALIDGRSRDTLLRHAERLKANPRQKVLLVGFTDDRGSSAYNSAIAEIRVNAVYKVLRELGVKPGQLRRYGAGGEKNRTPCSSDECRALMRRVELDYSGN